MRKNIFFFSRINISSVIVRVLSISAHSIITPTDSQTESHRVSLAAAWNAREVATTRSRGRPKCARSSGTTKGRRLRRRLRQRCVANIITTIHHPRRVFPRASSTIRKNSFVYTSHQDSFDSGKHYTYL